MRNIINLVVILATAIPLQSAEIERLGTLELDGAVGVDVGGDYAYCVAGTEIIVVDIANPAAPAVVTRQNIGRPVDIIVRDTIAYILHSDGRLQSMTISDPFFPRSVGSVGGGSRSYQFTIEGNRAFVISNGAVVIVDVSNPRNMFTTGVCRPASGSALAAAASQDDLMVAATDGHFTWRFFTYDISNPAQPAQTGSCGLQTMPYDMKCFNDQAFIPGPNFVTVVNVADMSSPELTGVYDTRAETQDVILRDTLAFIANGPIIPGNAGGLHVLDIRSPNRIGELARIDSTGSTSDLAFGADGLICAAELTQFAIYRYPKANSIEDLPVHVPQELTLLSPYPNPFNSTIRLGYDLPQATKVELGIYDLSGRLVENLVNRHQEAGEYHLQWEGSGVATGIYFVRLQAGKGIATKRILLIK
jgi:hypothetical protein